MKYGLFNKGNGKLLVHPRVGTWVTSDLKEAEDMLAACREYLNASGLQHIQDDFIIVDAETQEKV